MNYKHTQLGHLTIAILVLIGLPVIAVALAQMGTGDLLPVLLASVVILALVTAFISLTVSIDQTHLGLKYGWGLFNKKFLLSEIASVKAARHKWYHGWGIRYWFPERMWVYNISGFDVVELTMKNGRRARVGTDQPEELVAALEQAIR